jgi:hypothetical protein
MTRCASSEIPILQNRREWEWNAVVAKAHIGRSSSALAFEAMADRLQHAAITPDSLAIEHQLAECVRDPGRALTGRELVWNIDHPRKGQPLFGAANALLDAGTFC